MIDKEEIREKVKDGNESENLLLLKLYNKYLKKEENAAIYNALETYKAKRFPFKLRVQFARDKIKQAVELDKNKKKDYYADIVDLYSTLIIYTNHLNEDSFADFKYDMLITITSLEALLDLNISFIDYIEPSLKKILDKGEKYVK